MASATVYKPASKWTIVAAFIVAVVLLAGAVVWVEMQQEKPPVQVGRPVAIHSVEGSPSKRAPKAIEPPLPEEEPVPIDAPGARRLSKEPSPSSIV